MFFWGGAISLPVYIALAFWLFGSNENSFVFFLRRQFFSKKLSKKKKPRETLFLFFLYFSYYKTLNIFIIYPNTNKNKSAMSALTEISANSPRRKHLVNKPIRMMLSPPITTASPKEQKVVVQSPPKPVPTHDAYGFPNENGICVKNGLKTTKECIALWESYSASELSDFHTDNLQDIIFEHGIPKSRRSNLWYKWSGAEEKQLASNAEGKTYNQYCQETINSKVRQQIALDLPRTCPKHPSFLCENPNEEDESKQIVGPGRKSIGKILRAYAARNPELGYLQSMNFLAAMLYLVFDGDEPRMFWMMTTIVEDILPGYFTAKLAKLLENVDAFSIVLEQTYPSISKQLEKHGLNISFRAPTWFLCMYFTSLKSEVVTRIWDVIFYNVKRCPEGTCGPASLCCVGLGIINIVQKQILNSTNIAECAKALQNASTNVLDAKLLIIKSFKEIHTISEMVQRLSSKSIRGALKKQRDDIANRRTHRSSMTCRKPKRKRHSRSLSDGSIPLNFSIDDMEQQPGPQHSPNTNARIIANNKRRRVALQRHGVTTTSTEATSTLPTFSPFAAIKKWLTPKKATGTQSDRRRIPPATTRIRRINFGDSSFLPSKTASLSSFTTTTSSSSFSSTSSSTSRKLSCKKKRRPSLMLSGTPSGKGGGAVDSPRGNFELKMKKTPAKIRARALASTGYGTPPGAMTLSPNAF
jgi:hypothetical protein